MQSFPHLASPLNLGRLRLPNRIVMPPLVIWQSGQEGLVTDAHIEHYRRSAGPGLIVTEAACIAPNARLAATQIGVYSDDQLPGLARLAETIAATGAVPGIQIHHAGAQSTIEKNWGLAPVIVSPTEYTPDGARELDNAEINSIIAGFAEAAERAVQAGFQIVEIHGAHGYLGSQFLSPRHNHRSDAWGGSLDNRARFLRETVQAVAAQVGSRALVSCRLGVADQQLPLAEGIETARMLVGAGVELLNISSAGGMPKNPDGTVLSNTPDGLSALFNFACRTRTAVDVPVIGVGGIKTPQQAETALTRSEPVDLVAVGRGMLADPGWARKALSGHDGDIEICRDCRPNCFQFTDPERCPARRALGVPALV